MDHSVQSYPATYRNAGSSRYSPAGMASSLFTILLALKVSTKDDMDRLLVLVSRLNVVKTFAFFARDISKLKCRRFFFGVLYVLFILSDIRKNLIFWHYVFVLDIWSACCMYHKQKKRFSSPSWVRRAVPFLVVGLVLICCIFPQYIMMSSDSQSSASNSAAEGGDGAIHLDIPSRKRGISLKIKDFGDMKEFGECRSQRV